MNDEVGCVMGLAAVSILFLAVFMGGRESGQHTAHREYIECLGVRRTAQADSIAITLRPECKKWLQPAPAK